MKNISTSSENKIVNNLLAVLVVITVVLSLTSLYITYYKITNFKRSLITGYASSTAGYVNLTIYSALIINVSNQSIIWGSGTINTTGGWYNATLITNATGDGNVTCAGWTDAGNPCGNWSSTSPGPTRHLVVENIGTSNCSLFLGGKNYTQLFGVSVSVTNAAYQWLVHDKYAGACNAPLPGTFNVWTDANASVRVCNNFGFKLGVNALYIGVKIMVPYDVNVSGTTALDDRSDTITFTANTVV